MENYQVLARRYRPQNFASVVGQEPIVTTLKNALRQGLVAHAYLFCGSHGTGKTTLARVLAKALNCHQLSSSYEPCGTCPSCKEITVGASLDVMEIDGASNRGIEDIRQINETVSYAPAGGKFKIYIIDEVHMLTKEACNALLKTLEEPPSAALFFFATTEPHKILPTITSRCQRFDLRRITPSAISAKLKEITDDLQIECAPEALSLLAHLAEGSLRTAESLLDQLLCYATPPITLEAATETLGLLPNDAFFALDRAIHEQHFAYAFELTESLFASGKDLGYFLERLIVHFRTLLHVKCGLTQDYLSDQEHYIHSASLYTQEQCLSLLDYLVQWEQRLSKTPFKRLSLEMVLLHLIRSKQRVSLTTITKRLSELLTSENGIKDLKPEPKPREKAPPADLNLTKPVSKAADSSPAEEPPPPEKASAHQDEVDDFGARPKASPQLDEHLPEKPSVIEELLPLKGKGPSRHTSHYDTLVRFAAVELEGTIKTL